VADKIIKLHEKTDDSRFVTPLELLEDTIDLIKKRKEYNPKQMIIIMIDQDNPDMEWWARNSDINIKEAIYFLEVIKLDRIKKIDA